MTFYSSSMEAFNEWFVNEVWDSFGFQDFSTTDDEFFYGIRNCWIKENHHHIHEDRVYNLERVASELQEINKTIAQIEIMPSSYKDDWREWGRRCDINASGCCMGDFGFSNKSRLKLHRIGGVYWFVVELGKPRRWAANRVVVMVLTEE